MRSKGPRRSREHFTRIASGRPPSKRCHRVDSEDVEGTDESDEVCTGKADSGPEIHLEFGERFFMKEAMERASGAVKRDWEPRLIEARYLGQHARTGAMMGITADGIVCAIARSRTLGSNRLAISQRSTVGLATNRCAGT